MKYIALLSILMLSADIDAQTDSVGYDNMELVAVKIKNGKTFRIKKNRRVRVTNFGRSAGKHEPIKLFGKYRILDSISIEIKGSSISGKKSDTIRISEINYIRAFRTRRTIVAVSAATATIIGWFATGGDAWEGSLIAPLFGIPIIIPSLTRKEYSFGDKWNLVIHETP